MALLGFRLLRAIAGLWSHMGGSPSLRFWQLWIQPPIVIFGHAYLAFHHGVYARPSQYGQPVIQNSSDWMNVTMRSCTNTKFNLEFHGTHTRQFANRISVYHCVSRLPWLAAPELSRCNAKLTRSGKTWRRCLYSGIRISFLELAAASSLSRARGRRHFVWLWAGSLSHRFTVQIHCISS